MTEGLPIVQMRGISIEFPGVKALDGVDFRLLPGEVVTLDAPLRVRATAVGQRTLVVGERCMPFVTLGPVVELSWRREPLVIWLWGAVRQTILGKEVQLPCPVPAITTTLVPIARPAA